MGQAKNRGTRAQRMEDSKSRSRMLAEELGLKQRPLADIKADLGLPQDAQFHGYAVHIPSSDEFLMSFTDSADSTARQWVKGPERAKYFDQIADAHQLCRPNREEIVVYVFETVTQFFVAEVM